MTRRVYKIKKVTAEIIEKCRLFVAVKVRDAATESAIYDEIVNAYMADDYESIEQCIYDITNIKVKEK